MYRVSTCTLLHHLHHSPTAPSSSTHCISSILTSFTTQTITAAQPHQCHPSAFPPLYRPTTACPVHFQTHYRRLGPSLSHYKPITATPVHFSNTTNPSPLPQAGSFTLQSHHCHPKPPPLLAEPISATPPNLLLLLSLSPPHNFISFAEHLTHSC